MNNLPQELEYFIKNETWIFAKTYAETWPHEYIVEENVDKQLFLNLAKYIDTFGHKEKFYITQVTYLNFGKHTYWHMENIINRCLLEDTYEEREKNNQLPPVI